MLETLGYILIMLVVLGFLWWLVGKIPDPPLNATLKSIFQALVIVVFVIWCIYTAIGMAHGVHVPSLRG